MPNKALRILIADEQHFHRMTIERLFNALDYYRVAPVQSLAQMLTVIEYGYEPFDLVVINASLTSGALDLQGFLLDNPQVHHALVFNGQQARLPAIPLCEWQKLQVSHALLPDLPCIQRLMAIIDPPMHEDNQPGLSPPYGKRSIDRSSLLSDLTGSFVCTPMQKS